MVLDRAVNRAIARLKTGRTRLQDGEHDRRGGIIWHTQGSGKSLTSILVLVGEAHRSQAGELHANLLAALPSSRSTPPRGTSSTLRR